MLKHSSLIQKKKFPLDYANREWTHPTGYCFYDELCTNLLQKWYFVSPLSSSSRDESIQVARIGFFLPTMRVIYELCRKWVGDWDPSVHMDGTKSVTVVNYRSDCSVECDSRSQIWRWNYCDTISGAGCCTRVKTFRLGGVQTLHYGPEIKILRQEPKKFVLTWIFHELKHVWLYTVDFILFLFVIKVLANLSQNFDFLPIVRSNRINVDLWWGNFWVLIWENRS